jgi:hypothetical protein
MSALSNTFRANFCHWSCDEHRNSQCRGYEQTIFTHVSLPWWFDCCHAASQVALVLESRSRCVPNPQCGQAGPSRRRVDTGGVNRPTPRSHKRRLKTLLAIRCQNSASNGRSGLGWPLSFWKEVCRQYQCEWRAPSSIVDPIAGHVNSRAVERKDSQINQTQLVAGSGLLHRVSLCG